MSTHRGCNTCLDHDEGFSDVFDRRHCNDLDMASSFTCKQLDCDADFVKSQLELFCNQCRLHKTLEIDLSLTFALHGHFYGTTPVYPNKFPCNFT